MRWRPTRAGIRVRSAFAAAGVVAVALILAAGSLLLLLQQVLSSTAVAGVAARSHDLVALVADEGVEGLDLRAPLPAGDIIQVLDPDGKVRLADPPAALSARLVSTPLIVGRAQTRTVPAPSGSAGDEPYVVLATPVTDGGTGRTEVLVVARSLDGRSETLGVMGQAAAIGTPLLILLTALVTYAATGRALAPVESIRRQVQTITARRLNERVPVPDVRDEIGRLAETMNDMLSTLQRSHLAQQRFVQDASHELRSPLSVIIAGLENLRHGRRLPPDLDDVIGDLTVEAGRMGRLVEDLLLLTRADEGGSLLRCQDVDLDDLVEAEAYRLRRSGSCQAQLSSTPVQIEGDRDRLAQVLRNLTDNAVRHSRGQVRLSVTRQATHAVIRVEDDGPGVQEPDRRRIFERFVRLDESRQRASGGAGLGLPIVQEIVAAHHGQVTVRDSTLGGACFEVTLPLQMVQRRRNEADQPPDVSNR